MIFFRKLKSFYIRYESYLIPAALFYGFATDILTFRLVSFDTSLFFLLGHLIFAAVNIGIVNHFKNKEVKGKFLSYWKLLAPLLIQFSFGNLFSGFLIFYSQSGSLFASWPFLLVLVLLLIGNEVARRYDLGPIVQIGVYFFALFSYFNLSFPYFFRRLDVTMFIISGFFSLFTVFLLTYILSDYVKEIKDERKKLWITIGSVFLVMNFLYFSNLIPPIPLTIQSSGIYHDIERLDDGYRVESEPCESWDRCIFNREIRRITGERGRIYFYSAVYAPPGMDMTVTHRWEKYDEDQNRWVMEAIIPFYIRGGRDIGFRWYSYYTVRPGLWRVSTETDRGQVIGRKAFHVVQEINRSTIIEEI